MKVLEILYARNNYTTCPPSVNISRPHRASVEVVSGAGERNCYWCQITGRCSMQNAQTHRFLFLQDFCFNVVKMSSQIRSSSFHF